MKKSVEKGITLIALVVTIVVLLILAGISISMLTGENGVIIQARKSKEATEQAKVEELVSVAIGSVIAKNDGVVNGITPKMVADQINEDEKRSDVYAENETTFPTNIIFPKENRKAEANLNSKNTNDPNYSVSVDESDIAPVDLFDYEIIDNGETGALTLSSLPTKTVKITRVKPQYCNSGGYNPKSDSMDLENTNYEIIYQNKKIDDTLIIPYKVDGKYIPDGIEGEYYKVVEVDLYARGAAERHGEIGLGYGMPKVRKIIYPDTVESIYGVFSGIDEDGINNVLEEVILSKKMKIIGYGAFKGCNALKNIVIPDSVENIFDDAFDPEFWDSSPDGDIYLGKIYYRYKGEMPSGTIIQIKEGTKKINVYAFSDCSGLTKVTIPDSVKNIEYGAFSDCSGLTTINYRGTKEMWDNISIDEDNELLTNATINYNYTGE